jgi:hypothetical protein
LFIKLEVHHPEPILLFNEMPKGCEEINTAVRRKHQGSNVLNLNLICFIPTYIHTCHFISLIPISQWASDMKHVLKV